MSRLALHERHGSGSVLDRASCFRPVFSGTPVGKAKGALCRGASRNARPRTRRLGVHRIRHCGLFARLSCADNIARARELLVSASDRSRSKRWSSRRKRAAPGLQALHGSDGTARAVHCFRIVFSIGLRSAAMHFCLGAREFGGCPALSHSGPSRCRSLAERMHTIPTPRKSTFSPQTDPRYTRPSPHRASWFMRDWRCSHTLQVKRRPSCANASQARWSPSP